MGLVLDDVKQQFNNGLRNWLDAHRDRGDALDRACNALTRKSDGEIEAELKRGTGIQKAIEGLSSALYGCNIRQERWDHLKDHLVRNDPANAWMDLVNELRTLAEMSSGEISGEVEPPSIRSWDLSSNMRRRIIEKLTPRKWLDVALISLSDVPVFFYKGQGETRIEFSQASAGEQATALLKVLLQETGGPLIVDQPEEDLDNAVIQEVAEKIWEAKEKRQVIFASHNANIVVNGDADLVVHCDSYVDAGITRGKIEETGAIDIPRVRKTITRVMEGGAKAFKLRKQKYGF